MSSEFCAPGFCAAGGRVSSFNAGKAGICAFVERKCGFFGAQFFQIRFAVFKPFNRFFSLVRK